MQYEKPEIEKFYVYIYVQSGLVKASYSESGDPWPILTILPDNQFLFNELSCSQSKYQDSIKCFREFATTGIESQCFQTEKHQLYFLAGNEGI